MRKMKSVKIALLALMIPVCAFAKTRYISPNNDGVQDALEIPLRISDKRYVQGWSLVIMDENKNVVRTIENKVSLPEKLGFKTSFKQLITPKHGVEIPSSVTWNGTMDNGELAPDGTYYYYVTATDDNGNKGQTKDFKVVIDTVPPEVEIAQTADKIFGEGAKSSFKVRQSGSKEDLWVGTFLSADGKTVRTYEWKNSEPLEFSWKGTDDLDAQLPDGVYSYDITATDRAGNKAAKTGISNIIYSAEKPATNIYLASSRYFSPSTDSAYKDVKFDITIPVPEEKSGNKLVEWALTVEDKAGKAVRVYNQSNTGSVPFFAGSRPLSFTSGGKVLAKARSRTSRNSALALSGDTMIQAVSLPSKGDRSRYSSPFRRRSSVPWTKSTCRLISARSSSLSFRGSSS